MTLLEGRPRAAAALDRDVEEALARLVDVIDPALAGDATWAPPALARWVAEQPDPERALGQLVRAAGRLTVARRPPTLPSPDPTDPDPTHPDRPAPTAPDPAPVDAGAADGPSRSRQRRARVCLWVRNAGCLLLAFLAYQWWGTGFEQHRAQVQLQQSFQASSVRTGASAAKAATAAAGPQPDAAAQAAAPATPLPGSAVAHLEIPAIALDEYVVEGTGEADLKKGPGHYAGSPLPGQHGNAALAGHRTTYGAPFGRLDDLKAGDTIVATTAAGRSVYTVTDKLTVLPTQTSVVQDYGDDRLTLTTCTPKFSASHRLIVVAHLQGPATGDATRRSPAPATVAPAEPSSSGGHSPVAMADGRTGFDVGALPAALLAALAVIGLALLYQPVRRRWPPLAAAAVLIPLWMGVLLMFCESLNRFLPANV
jgi:sortase A